MQGVLALYVKCRDDTAAILHDYLSCCKQAIGDESADSLSDTEDFDLDCNMSDEEEEDNDSDEEFEDENKEME